MFDELVESLRRLLPGFGTNMAIDSKAIDSWSQGKKDPAKSSDPDARWGKKTYRGVHKKGTLWEKTKAWFGYKVHLIVDADYELPVCFDITGANQSDKTYLLPMVERLDKNHPELLQDAKTLSGDKGYDSENNVRTLWDEHNIKPVIDITRSWKEDPHLPRPLDPDRCETIFYNQEGEVLCRCRDTEDESRNYIPLTFCGFEEKRSCLKYRCWVSIAPSNKSATVVTIPTTGELFVVPWRPIAVDIRPWLVAPMLGSGSTISVHRLNE